MHHRTARGIAALAVFAVVTSVQALVGPAPAGAVSLDIVISEVYGGGGNTGAPYTNDFVELVNRGEAAASTSGWSVQYASSTGTGNFASNSPVALPAVTLQPGQHLLVRLAGGVNGDALPAADATGTINMSASAGKVIVASTATGLACNGGSTPCTEAQQESIVDLVGYGGANYYETAPAPAASNTTSVSRVGSGCTDTDNNSADFTSGVPTPRNTASPASDCGVPPPPPDDCDTPATHEIAEVQGSGTASPLAGQTVRIEGVVTGDFQGGSRLNGFFLQDDSPDTDAATSDGVFVFSPSAPDVVVGDRVLASGTAVEFNGLTEVTNTTAVDVCGTGTVAAAPQELPRPSGTTFEPVEGVLVTFPLTLTATEHFQLGRFGELTVASDGRLFQPTDRVAPGADAAAMLELANRRRLLVDDGSNVQNPATVPFVAPGDAIRIGDTTSGMTGVMSFGFGLYRLQPTAAITFDRTNPRPAAPEPVGGDVQVASFNTLNYFTTLGSENPDARGADTATEFERQQAKEVAAITGLDADVLGLMEVENNGAEAVASLVDALNAATAPGTYAYVTEPALNPPNEFGGTFGTDAIKVTFIYKPAVVTPAGPAQTSADPVFDRPPLVQTFAPVAGGEAFTLAVNHFKSKNCGGTGPDEDQGDGQSCFNARRIAQADALADLLDGLDVPNPLIIGDLNAYTEEDPIHVLEDAGYTGLSELFVEDALRYSFVFDGFSGELDHAMAGADVLDNVTGTTIWHINADEPLILDYNTEFNPPGLYAPDAYRSSDHDPLLVGLELTAAPAAPEVSALAGYGAATVSWAAPADGGSAITGYEVSALVDGDVVGSASVGAGETSYTFGDLANGVVHTFEVVAVNGDGAGPAGSATATPFVPASYTRLDAAVACPAFTVTNGNAFPVSFSWATPGIDAGTGAVAAGDTVTVEAETRDEDSTPFVVRVAGKQQDRVVEHC